MQRADFVVIGAGIAGASVAYRLSEYGHVMMLEKESAAGYHTSGRSASLFTESFETGVVRELTTASRGFLEDPPAGFASHPLLSAMPVLFIGREHQRPSLRAALSGVRGRVAGVRWIAPDEAQALCPVLRADHIAGGVYESRAMTIDVHALHRGYLRGVRANHGEVRLESEVIGLARESGGWAVRWTGGEALAPVVVNAAGAWCDSLGRMAGARAIGLVPMRRTAFTFGPPDGMDAREWPAVVDIDQEFYFKPEGRQIMGSPADETPMKPHDVRAEEIDVARAIERIEAATTLRIRHVHSTWAGLRSFVPDRLPVVGMDPDRSGFFWLAGQGGFGIMTSPAVSLAAAGLIAEGRLPRDLAALGLTPELLGPARLGG